MGLRDIIKQNHYPIVFIGSGMSKRYLDNSPTWNDLLEEYWKKLNLDKSMNFYSYLHNINDEYKDKPKNELDFLTNTKAGSKIEEIFNKAFFDNKLPTPVPNLTIKDAQQNHVSPFKYDLAERFKSLTQRNDIATGEFELFSDFLQKSRIIVTTNYDSLVEDTITKYSSQKPKIYIGNSGFFDESSDGWSEIYKIHGSSTDPNSIVINQSDYDEYDKNSILISAKILSSMIDSPIIFLGYSLTDRDIRKMLADFSKQLPQEDARKSANRIFVVEYKENEQKLEEQIIKDSDLNYNYTLIQTDNYKSLYSEVIKIDEGVTPYEVRKFQRIIKKIIVTSGKKKALDSFLVHPTDLENLENKVDDGKPIVVALGDTKNIFITPTPTSYLDDYISQKFEIEPEVALRFVAREQKNGRYPILQHAHSVSLDKTNLDEFEKENIRDRLKRDEPSLESIQSTISENNRKTFHTIKDIKSLPDCKMAKKIDYITYNSDKLNKTELTKYVQKEALPAFIKLYKERNKRNAQEKTAYRKLFVAWDILNYSK